MGTVPAGPARPPLHLLAVESDRVASLALQIEYRNPAIATMLLDEIERAELHEPETLPPQAITIGSQVDFVDEGSRQMRSIELVYPALANIALGRISILTPMGVALYGLTAGQVIDWPDIEGHERRIRILRVQQPLFGEPSGAA